MCVLDIHLGNVLPRTAILITYNGLHAKMQKTEQGSGSNIFASHAFQIAGKRLLSFVIYSKPF